MPIAVRTATFRLLLAAACAAVLSDADATTGYGPMVVATPSVPEHWPEVTDTVDVDVEFSLGNTGEPMGARIVSQPTAFDDEVLKAIVHWRYVPTVASDCSVNQNTVRQRLRFERREEGASIVIREPEILFAKDRSVRPPIGEGQRIRDDLGRDRIMVRYRELEYPTALMGKRLTNITRGYVLAELVVSAAGNVVEVRTPLSFPKGYFEASLQDEMMGWQFDRVVDAADALDGRICVAVRYQVKDSNRSIR